jgi:hypothetical protein
MAKLPQSTAAGCSRTMDKALASWLVIARWVRVTMNEVIVTFYSVISTASHLVSRHVYGVELPSLSIRTTSILENVMGLLSQSVFGQVSIGSSTMYLCKKKRKQNIEQMLINIDHIITVPLLPHSSPIT